MANAPRADGSVEFHIRLIDGGAVSMALTTQAANGAALRIGPPVGSLRLDPGSGRQILMVAGSTGLAPLKAMIEQLAGIPQPPGVHLFFGARAADGLYDLPGLEKFAAEHRWLTVVPVVSSQRSGDRAGTLTETVMRSGAWSARDAYIAGPTEMVQDSAARLAAAGMPAAQIHVEDFGWSEQ
jgi:NAD(P)H-flavin reductase